MNGTPMTSRELKPIPQLDLKAQFAAIETEIRAAIEEVLASQQFILGPQGAALEDGESGLRPEPTPCCSRCRLAVLARATK